MIVRELLALIGPRRRQGSFASADTAWDAPKSAMEALEPRCGVRGRGRGQGDARLRRLDRQTQRHRSGRADLDDVSTGARLRGGPVGRPLEQMGSG